MYLVTPPRVGVEASPALDVGPPQAVELVPRSLGVPRARATSSPSPQSPDARGEGQKLGSGAGCWGRDLELSLREKLDVLL